MMGKRLLFTDNVRVLCLSLCGSFQHYSMFLVTLVMFLEKSFLHTGCAHSDLFWELSRTMSVWGFWKVNSHHVYILPNTCIFYFRKQCSVHIPSVLQAVQGGTVPLNHTECLGLTLPIYILRSLHFNNFLSFLLSTRGPRSLSEFCCCFFGIIVLFCFVCLMFPEFC